MRQHKILIRTLLILSIFNFALAAPAGVRARPEVHLGVGVIRNVPTASQKRGDPWDWGRTPSEPAPNYAPAPSPDLADILSQIPDTNSPPLIPDYVPDHEHEPTSSPDSTGIPPQIVYVDTPSPTPDHGPPQIVYVDTPSPTPDHGPPQIVHIDSPSPTPDYSLPPSPDNTGSAVPSELWDNVAGSLPRLPSLPTPPHPSQPGPSEDHSPNPSGPSANPDTPPATGSTDNQPAPPQSPEVDPQVHSMLNPEPFPAEFWDKVLKGMFKRRISGSDAVNLARKDTRSGIFQPS